jgi:dolichol-phosphate mannosyltransferase
MPIPSPDLCLVIPTYQERENVAPLIQALHTALDGISWEAIFVDDDSPDDTTAEVRRLARDDTRIRCMRRVGRRGLSSACIEGMLSTSAPYIAVMDADMQHDERLLPVMLETLRREDVDVVIASRYMQGSDVGDWDTTRHLASRFATRLGRTMLKQDLSDPMSGFFMFRRDVVDDSVRRLSGLGFKILADMLLSSPKQLTVRELPYQFRTRVSGQSKFDGHAALDYLLLLLDKTVGRFIPVRFVSFSIVGAVGVVVHLAVVGTLFELAAASFVASQAVASFVAILSNYTLNNLLTFRDMRLRGWRWLKGLISFTTICGLGAMANVGVAAYIFEYRGTWVLAAVAGILVAAVWNFAVSQFYTWGRRL